MYTEIKHFLFLLLVLFCSCSNGQTTSQQDTYNHTHSIPFLPEKYVSYHTNSSLQIDGLDNESDWQKAAWTKKFVDIEGNLQPQPKLDTQVKMLWDDNYFYFFAKMYEPHIWAKLQQRDTVIFYDDDFEIFIDPDGDSHNYYELEVNAFNTLWELILLRPYRADGAPKVLNNWNIPNILSAIHIEGTLNNPSDTDKFWTVEMAVPWSALNELAPRKKPKTGDQWRVNFSRVDWTMNIKNGKYLKAKDAKGKNLPENNWVWSPTGFINMHMPEQWGYVQFSEKKIGNEKDEFIMHQDEQIKQALWNLYFQQRKYFKKNKTFTNDLSFFTIPNLEPSNCTFNPQIFITPNMFEIIAPSCERDGNWSIRQDGKIDFFKNKSNH